MLFSKEEADALALKLAAEAEETLAQGKVIVTASAGTKKDGEANKPGSPGDPKVEREVPLPQRRFPNGEFSKVGLTFGLTKSLGNFEFARIDVYVEDFCAPDKKVETLDEINKIASDYTFRISKDIEQYVADKKAAKAGQGF